MTEPVHEGSNRPKTVLLVEDDFGVRDSFMKGLINHGFDILEAASGDEALNLVHIRKEAIDVAVVDMSMPVMWGDEFAQRLAEISPETKVIFVSGHSEDFLRSGGALTGNEIFFAKPFSPKLLLEKIREILGIEVPVVPAIDSGTSPPVESLLSPSFDFDDRDDFDEHDDLHIETDRHVE